MWSFDSLWVFNNLYISVSIKHWTIYLKSKHNYQIKNVARHLHVLHLLDTWSPNNCLYIDDLKIICWFIKFLFIRTSFLTFSCLKRVRILISRKVRWQKVWCSKGDIFLIATLSFVRVSNADLSLNDQPIIVFLEFSHA